MEEWGKILKKAREEKNISLEEAEEATKIQRIYLQALEEEDLERLPEKVYTLSFIRTYARFLGLDPEPFVRNIKERYAQSEPHLKEEAPPQGRVPGTRRWGTVFRPLIIIIIVVFIFVGVGYFIGFFPLTAKEVSPTPTPYNSGGEETKTEEPVQEEIVPQKLVVELSVPSDPDASCWVRVSSDGEIVFEGILEAGEKRSFEALQEMEIKMGNAGNMSITVNGKDLGIQGEPGSVVTKKFNLKDFQ